MLRLRQLETQPIPCQAQDTTEMGPHASLFPKNRQATPMNCTLCQGALKPPANAAALGLVTQE